MNAIVAGSAPSDYEFGTDASNATSGRRSAYILALPLASASGFGTLMQTIVADDYRGARWRLTASLRTEDATRAQLWMRVDGADRKVLAFDNMDARPLIGTRPWAPYEIVLDVPADAVSISFGFVLAQHGKVWADGFRLEKVPLSVPITARAATPPRAPVNTDFEN